MVESFVYLGTMIHSSSSSDLEIHRRCAMIRSAMQSLDRHLWRSHINHQDQASSVQDLHTPDNWLRVWVLCNQVNKADLEQIDALDQWCSLPTKHPSHIYDASFFGICWHDFVRNADVRYMSNQHSHPLSSLVVFLSLGILREWMRMQMPAKSFSLFSLFPRAGDIHVGGHVLTWMKNTQVPWIWSCMKPEQWLRIYLSGDWRLCIALHSLSGACYYWIAIAHWLSAK